MEKKDRELKKGKQNGEGGWGGQASRKNPKQRRSISGVQPARKAEKCLELTG